MARTGIQKGSLQVASGNSDIGCRKFYNERNKVKQGLIHINHIMISYHNIPQ